MAHYDEQRLDTAAEQLKDIWMGRHTYNHDGEWLERVDAAMKELCDEICGVYQSPFGIRSMDEALIADIGWEIR